MDFKWVEDNEESIFKAAPMNEETEEPAQELLDEQDTQPDPENLFPPICPILNTWST